MQRKNVKLLCKKIGLNQSDLARLAGVSRQAVSLWFKKEEDFINIKSRNLDRLCRGLGISPDELLKDLPELEPVGAWRTQFLWDRLYPDLESFALFKALDWISLAMRRKGSIRPDLAIRTI